MAKHVLIVDDDTILSGLLKLTLELEGYAVSTARDGAEGLEMVKRTGFDLILLDLIMPKVDGLKFLRLLNLSGDRRPPIMIVSSAAGTELTDQNRGLGVVAIARKPVEPAELVRQVRRALEDKS